MIKKLVTLGLLGGLYIGLLFIFQLSTGAPPPVTSTSQQVPCDSNEPQLEAVFRAAMQRPEFESDDVVFCLEFPGGQDPTPSFMGRFGLAHVRPISACGTESIGTVVLKAIAVDADPKFFRATIWLPQGEGVEYVAMEINGAWQAESVGRSDIVS